MKKDLKILTISFLLATCNGCSPALISLPKQDCPKVVTQVVKPPLEVPPARGDNIKIIMQDGKIEQINTEGYELLKNYHDIRIAIKNY